MNYIQIQNSGELQFNKSFDPKQRNLLCKGRLPEYNGNDSTY